MSSVFERFQNFFYELFLNLTDGQDPNKIPHVGGTLALPDPLNILIIAQDLLFVKGLFLFKGLASEVVCEDALPRMTYQGPRSVFLSLGTIIIILKIAKKSTI